MEIVSDSSKLISVSVVGIDVVVADGKGGTLFELIVVVFIVVIVDGIGGLVIIKSIILCNVIISIVVSVKFELDISDVDDDGDVDVVIGASVVVVVAVVVVVIVGVVVDKDSGSMAIICCAGVWNTIGAGTSTCTIAGGDCRIDLGRIGTSGFKIAGIRGIDGATNTDGFTCICSFETMQ